MRKVKVWKNYLYEKSQVWKNYLYEKSQKKHSSVILKPFNKITVVSF